MKPKCRHCVTHLNLANYMARVLDDDRRAKLGQKKRRCPVCKLWFWEAEFRKEKKT